MRFVLDPRGWSRDAFQMFSIDLQAEFTLTDPAMMEAKIHSDAGVFIFEKLCPIMQIPNLTA